MAELTEADMNQGPKQMPAGQGTGRAGGAGG